LNWWITSRTVSSSACTSFAITGARSRRPAPAASSSAYTAPNWYCPAAQSPAASTPPGRSTYARANRLARLVQLLVVLGAADLEVVGQVIVGVAPSSQEAQATLGSIYHFFPGGKEAVAVAAIKYSTEEFATLLRKALDSDDDPAEAVMACARQLADELSESGWIDGCPVTAAALATLGTDSEIQQACADALRSWEQLVCDKLLRCGLPSQSARELSITIISALEGAEVTAQVNRSVEPLQVADRQLARLVRSYEVQGVPGESGPDRA
jgi:TetR/AcrR family transcriptional repressor of lmrAB and yxaGH operons